MSAPAPGATGGVAAATGGGDPAGFRLPGASEAVRTLVPGGLDPVFVVVTALGGVTVLTFGLAVLYWTGVDRRGTAAVVAYGFVGYGVVVALKAWFAMPRPPEAVRVIVVEGYGFPSGHAAAATVVYGGLAAEFGWLEDARKAAATAGLVAAVALSRVVLGVHYLGDVLAGVGVGLVVLLFARTAAAGDPRPGGDEADPRRAFGAGILTAVAAVAVTGAGTTALGILGACIGGVAGTSYLDRVPRGATRVEAAVLVVVGVAFVAGLRVAEAPLAGLPAGAAVDDFLLVAGVLLSPLAVARAGVGDRSGDGEAA